MKKNKTKRVFSIFKVYDYKGGELSATTNISFDDVVGELIESGIIEHDAIEYSDDLYQLSDDKIRKICDECELKDDEYAGGDSTVISIYEHKKKRQLVSIEADEFKPYFADYIIRNK